MTQQPQGYQHQPWGPPTNTLAVVAICLAFVVFPAGFVLGIIALSQIKRTGEDGRGLAIAAIAISSVIGALALAFVAVAISLCFSGAFDDGPAGRVAEVGSTEVGSCLRITVDRTSSRVVDCGTAHDEEVSFSTTITGGSYPGDRAISSIGDGECKATFEDYVGVSWSESGSALRFYAPDRGEWRGGERRLVCVITPGPLGAQFHESQQGSAS